MSDPRFNVVRRTDKGIDNPFTGSKDAVILWLTKQRDVTGLEVFSANEKIYYSITEFFQQVVSLMPKYYKMDPQTDDMLPNGHYLVEGMKVLIGNPDMRDRPESSFGAEWEKDKLLTRNRWCTVTYPQVSEKEELTFVGVYEDGTKRQHIVSAHYAWLVKKDSIPDPMARYNEVCELVHEAIRDVMFGETDEEIFDSAPEPDPEVKRIIDETAKKILRALG